MGEKKRRKRGWKKKRGSEGGVKEETPTHAPDSAAVIH
jgi:hypothetical protein